MNYKQSIQLLNEVQKKLRETSNWQYFWNNISVADLSQGCSYIYERLDALGAYDPELNEFLSVFLRAEKTRFDRFVRKEQYFLLTVGMTVNYKNYRIYARNLLTKVEKLKRKVKDIESERKRLSHNKINPIRERRMYQKYS